MSVVSGTFPLRRGMFHKSSKAKGVSCWDWSPSRVKRVIFSERAPLVACGLNCGAREGWTQGLVGGVLDGGNVVKTKGKGTRTLKRMRKFTFYSVDFPSLEVPTRPDDERRSIPSFDSKVSPTIERVPMF